MKKRHLKISHRTSTIFHVPMTTLRSSGNIADKSCPFDFDIVAINQILKQYNQNNSQTQTQAR
jgi:hypothetical protein